MYNPHFISNTPDEWVHLSDGPLCNGQLIAEERQDFDGETYVIIECTKCKYKSRYFDRSVNE